MEGKSAHMWVHSYLLLVDDFANVLHAVDCSPYFSTDGGRLIFLSLVNSFYDGLRTVLLHGWQWIAHTSACQQLSQQFTRHNTQQMAADC